jgi:hypothetical protein
MILYVNGDSHTAGAEATNPHCFAEDDYLYSALGRQPHPDNLKVSWGCELANMMGAVLHCDAESASSNDRIIRTTREYLKNFKPDYVVIGWSTWEREEWLRDGIHWQVNAGGIGKDWPIEIKDQYKNWIVDLDFESKKRKAEYDIWKLHQELTLLEIPHLFFTCYESFAPSPAILTWGDNYIHPYDNKYTYYNWCKSNGFKTVVPTSYHFGPDAHSAWAKFLFKYMSMKELKSDRHSL